MGRTKPLTFDERFETKLPYDKNILSQIIDKLKVFASERQMDINSDRSSGLMFSKSRTKAFPAEIKVDEQCLEFEQKMEIIGVILTSDLQWEANTEYICQKAY